MQMKLRASAPAHRWRWAVRARIGWASGLTSSGVEIRSDDCRGTDGRLTMTAMISMKDEHTLGVLPARGR